jgi:hypothetical protein
LLTTQENGNKLVGTSIPECAFPRRNESVLLSEIFTRMPGDRRAFLQKIAGAAAFATPAVRTFMVAATAATLAADPAYGQYSSSSFSSSRPYSSSSAGRGVPEINATTAGAAAIALAGGVMVLRSRNADTAEATPAASTDAE